MSYTPTVEGYGIVTEWTGDVIEKLQSICAKIDDKGPALRAVGHWAAVQFQKNILESHTPEGFPFAPLKKPRGKGRNPDSRPLFDTGSMYDDIRFEENSGDSSVTVGTSIPYAIFQNDGTSRIPARTFIGVADSDLPPIVTSVAKYIFSGDEGEAEAGLTELIA